MVFDEGAGALARARRLGRNVVEAMRLPIGEVAWMGDEMGTCPVCHSDLLTVTRQNPVICPICGIKGWLRTDGDAITVEFTEDNLNRSATMGKLLPGGAKAIINVGYVFTAPWMRMAPTQSN